MLSPWICFNLFSNPWFLSSNSWHITLAFSFSLENFGANISVINQSKCLSCIGQFYTSCILSIKIWMSNFSNVGLWPIIHLWLMKMFLRIIGIEIVLENCRLFCRLLIQWLIKASYSNITAWEKLFCTVETFIVDYWMHWYDHQTNRIEYFISQRLIGQAYGYYITINRCSDFHWLSKQLQVALWPLLEIKHP